MMNPTSINLQIDRFCNCEGCIQKVKTTFRELGGVKMLAMDPDNGIFTILTAKPTEIVQSALQKKLKKNVNIQQETGSLPNSLSAFNNPRNLISPSSLVIPQGNVDVHDLANALVTISHAEGLQSVEYTQSNTFKFNFNNPKNRPSTSWSPITSHNIRGSNGVYYEDVPPLPPPPPPTTEPSAPLIPTSQYQVYGYPSEFYGFPKSSMNDYDDPQDCCNIL